MTIINSILNYVIWYMQPLLGLLIGVLVLSFVGYINWVGTIKRDTTSWFAKHLFEGGIESDASADGLFMAVSGFAVMFGGILIVLAILYLNHWEKWGQAPQAYSKSNSFLSSFHIMDDWPFDDPKNVAVFTTVGVVNAEEYISTVTHDKDDGAWQFIGSGGAAYSNAVVVSLAEIVKLDPSRAELFDLPPGWTAFRETSKSAWQRRRGRP